MKTCLPFLQTNHSSLVEQFRRSFLKACSLFLEIVADRQNVGISFVPPAKMTFSPNRNICFRSTENAVIQ